MAFNLQILLSTKNIRFEHPRICKKISLNLQSCFSTTKGSEGNSVTKTSQLKDCSELDYSKYLLLSQSRL